MAVLQQHPEHVRKKIAVLITVGVACVLVLLFIYTYTRKDTQPNESGSKLGTFYTTLLEQAQSIFTRE
jgi:hypothetical protein